MPYDHFHLHRKALDDIWNNITSGTPVVNSKEEPGKVVPLSSPNDPTIGVVMNNPSTDDVAVIRLTGSAITSMPNTASSDLFTLPTVRSEEELKVLEDAANVPGMRLVINSVDDLFWNSGPPRTITFPDKPKIKRKKTEKIITLKDQMKDVPD